MKSHILTYGIKEINLPQIGRGLDKLEWARVSNILLCLFANTDIRVHIFMQKVHVNSNLDNTFLAEEYPNDEKTRLHVFHTAAARKLTLEGMLKTPTINRNNRATELRAINFERRIKNTQPTEN